MFLRKFVLKQNYFNYLNKRFVTRNYGLVYERFGEPIEVLRKTDLSHDISKPLESNQVLIALKASPIHWADINLIQGVYPINHKLPAIAGTEGVAEVMAIGSEVSNVRAGDRVIPELKALGTWRSRAIMNANDLIHIDKDIDVLSAAQINANPCTAYRMLRDYIPLAPGDTVLQNGANSAVGLNVIQLAKTWGINTINVIRKRPDLDALKARLFSLGATHVVTEEEVKESALMNGIFQNCPKPKLVLNCVGGKNASDCMRHLCFGGAVVTYGAMSKQPITIPAGSLIFKNNKFYGFWMSKWIEDKANREERTRMLASLCDLTRSGQLKSPHTIAVGLDDYKEAIVKTMSAFTDSKYVFRLD